VNEVDNAPFYYYQHLFLMNQIENNSMKNIRRMNHKISRVIYTAAIVVLFLAPIVLTGCTGLVRSSSDACSPNEIIAPGWVQSYKAGYRDSSGHYAGGSEILHLVGHKGKLYAASGYWMDPRNIWYGGSDNNIGWGQILRLDLPDGKWEVDLDMGPTHLRPEILNSITFITDGKGNALKEPVNLLIASAYSPWQGRTEVNFFVREDKTGKWGTSKILSGFTGESGENNSVRCVRVYCDKVTGIERVFISIGTLGVFSGVYDPDAPGKIRWDSHSESGRVKTRPLAIIEANGALIFSAGSSVYRRNDGQSPTYTVVHDLGDIFPGEISSPVGGIRGLTPIPNPNGKGESLLFVLGEGGRSQGCIYRLDPDGKGGYTRTQEACLDSLMTQYLYGNPVYFILAAYNNILPVVDPSTKETVHLIGFESWIGGDRFPIGQRGPNGGFYAGAMYAIRDKKGKYRVNEVNGPSTSCKPVLIATRAYVLSPFAEDGNNVIYFGGHDCNDKTSHNTAWIFSTSLENALHKDAPRP
jgi:poly(A) polymerase